MDHVIFQCGSCDPHLYNGGQYEQDKIGHTEAGEYRVTGAWVVGDHMNHKCWNPKQSSKNKSPDPSEAEIRTLVSLYIE